MGTDTGDDASCDEIIYKVANQYPIIDGCDFNNIDNWGKIVPISVLNGWNTESDVDILAITDTEDQTNNEVSTLVSNDPSKKSAQAEQECDPTYVENTDSDDNRTGSKRNRCTFEGCTMTFVRPWRLSAHLNTHLGKRPFKCPVLECGKDYTNNSHLRRHMIQSHSTAPYVTRWKCPSNGCLMELANSTALRRHIQRRHSSNAVRFPCTQCDAGFHKHFQLTDHKHLHHGTDAASVEPRYRCSVCRRCFHERAVFKKHERKHRVDDYKCRHAGCTVETSTWTALRKHVKQEHPPRYPCNECDREFKTKCNLQQHKETHQSVKHTCKHPGCNKEYAQKRNLVNHMVRRHCGLQFPCTYAGCSTHLSTKQKLANHIATTHEGSKSQTKVAVKKSKKARKDLNVPKRSMVSKLLGIVLPITEEKKLLNGLTKCNEQSRTGLEPNKE